MEASGDPFGGVSVGEKIIIRVAFTRRGLNRIADELTRWCASEWQLERLELHTKLLRIIVVAVLARKS